MPKYFKALFIIPLYLLSLLLLSTSTFAYDYLLFEDDFESPNLNKWTVPRNTCTDSWEYKDGKYGMIINSGFCLSETSPSDLFWDNGWNDYVYELDLEIISGVNQNIAWRYWPTVPERWIDVQMVYGSIKFQGATETSRNNTFKISPGKYHFKIVADGEDQKVYYYNVLDPSNIGYLEGKANGVNRLLGRPALQVSDGAGVKTEVWFDNIRVTREVDSLDVPYFSQLDPTWRGDIYDSSDGDIGNYGCALASAAMILRYHGINTIPDTSDTVTPATLNTWLLENGGYDEKGNMSFAEIATLSKEAVSENPEDFSFDALKFSRIDYPNEDAIDYVNNTLLSEERPLIFKLLAPLSPSKYHYNVVQGVITEDEKYLTLDPLNEINTVTEIPPNSILAAFDFIPSNTDLSYLMLHTDESLRISVEDPAGSLNGDIDLSFYGLELPLGNYLNPDVSLGDKYWSFEQEYPTDGKYQVSLEVDKDGFYNVWLASYDVEGDKFLFNEWLYLKADSPSDIVLTNNPDDSKETRVEFIPGYELGCEDIAPHVDYLYQNGHIKHKGVHKLFMFRSKYCKWMQKRYPKHYKIINRYLRKRIHKLHPRYIDDFAKETLLTLFGN